ncbi:MAG: NAD(P)-dependent oxidoreductase [Opitutales bacterium]
MKAKLASLRLGIIGTGFIATHLATEILRRGEPQLAKVLTRRALDTVTAFPASDRLTHSLDVFLNSCDVVFECSGDAFHAFEVIGEALQRGKPVLTLNPEFHVTVGSHFAGKGLLTEAAGDQPGSIAALHRNACEWGFEPKAVLNLKGFYNPDPEPEEMRFWAEKKGNSVEMVTSFTDGTKIQVEQCLVANGLGMGIAKEGLVGLETADTAHAATYFGELAGTKGEGLSDFIIDRSLGHGVLVIATHDPAQKTALVNMKMGEGPYYVVEHFCCLLAFEALQTLRQVMETGQPLLTNSAQPRFGVASLAKKPIAAGTRLERGAGSFLLRGITVDLAERAGHLPINLAQNITFKRDIEPGELVLLEDVEIADSPVLRAWKSIESGLLTPA